MQGANRWLCYYDADCGICTALARFAQRLDRRGRIEFVPNYEQARLPEGVDSQLVQDTIVVVEPGGPEPLLRAAAVAALLLQLTPFQPLGVLLRLPGMRGLADRAYRLVARNRMHISRALGLGVCRIPTQHGEPPGRLQE